VGGGDCLGVYVYGLGRGVGGRGCVVPDGEHLGAGGRPDRVTPNNFYYVKLDRAKANPATIGGGYGARVLGAVTYPTRRAVIISPHSTHSPRAKCV
jgi:hypothetical protein